MEGVVEVAWQWQEEERLVSGRREPPLPNSRHHTHFATQYSIIQTPARDGNERFLCKNDEHKYYIVGLARVGWVGKVVGGWVGRTPVMGPTPLSKP